MLTIIYNIILIVAYSYLIFGVICGNIWLYRLELPEESTKGFLQVIDQTLAKHRWWVIGFEISALIVITSLISLILQK